MNAKVKINLAIIVILCVIGGLFFLGKTGFSVLSGLRAYVGGEGLWAKNQKEATFHLAQYMFTRDKSHYQSFSNSLKVPLGDKVARLELEKTSPNYEIIFQGFIQGGNHPKDIPMMIFLYDKFKSFNYISKAIEQWEIGDKLVEELIKIGKEIHQFIANGNIKLEYVLKYLATIEGLQKQLNEAENLFSHYISEAARWTAKIVLVIMVGFTGIGSVICILMLRLIAGIISDLNDKNEQLKIQTDTEKFIRRELIESENRLKKVLETLPMGIWFTDSKGKIIYGNPAVQEIWQGARYVGLDELNEYKAWWRNTGKRITPEEWSIYRAIKKSETSREEEIEIECFDGTHKIILNWAAPILDADGDIYGAVAVNQDISDRVMMDEQLKIQKRILDRSQEIAHLGSWHLDIKKNILTWSDEAYRLFGLTPQEFGATYEAFLDTVHPDDREMVDKTYTHAIKNNLPYECIHRIIKKNGEVRVVLEKSEDIVDEKGETIHSFGFTQDITEQQHAEQEREKIIEKLQKSLDEIKTLRGILPICSFCKNIRNDEGYYEKIEAYIHKHSGVDFSHTICPSCMEKHYPNEYVFDERKKKE